MRSPARLAPYALLALAAALALLLSGDGVGQAQTTEQVLVTNFGQTVLGDQGFTTALPTKSQAFTTGGSGGGYTLSSIELKISTVTTVTTPTVMLRSGSATTTEGQVALTGPAALTANTTRGEYTFTAPSNTTLAADTTYWIVVTGSATQLLGGTASTMEDATPAAGWSIADVSSSAGTIFYIRVNGTINPVPLVLVSNYLVGGTETETYKSLADFDVVQAFTTGVGSGQFTLSSIDIRLRTMTSTVTPTMKLLSGSAQGTEVATLTGPSALDANMTKDYEFTPSSAVTLSARTQYWVFIEGGAAEVVRAELFRAEETAEPGWTLENTTFARDDASIDVFNVTAFPMLIRVKGNIVDLPAAAATGVPTITAPNVFRVPAVLKADLSGIFDDNGIAGIEDSATYKWQRFAADGTTLEMDGIGTSATYTLTDDDAGKTLKVVVSFMDDAGTQEGPLTSAATEAITAAATDCSAPTYVGGADQVWTGKVGIADHPQVGQSGHGFFDFTPVGSDVSGGSLDNRDFTTDRTFSVYVMSHNHSLSTFAVWLQVPGAASTATITEAVAHYAAAFASANRLTLHICDTPLAFVDVVPNSIQSIAGEPFVFSYTWTNPGIDWSTHAERTVYISRDEVAPTLSSAAVDGTELTLTFSEELGEADSLANTAFTVKRTPMGGTEETLTLSSTAPVISGRVVTLTLASASSIATTDTDVKVTYTLPTTGTDNKIVDLFGNEVATFTDEAVTIGTVNTPATGAPAITAPNVFRVPAVLSVDPSGITDANGTTNFADNATYKWQRFAADGTTLEMDSIGTGATYTLTDADAGKRIKVVVSYTDDDNYSEGPLTSAATDVIVAAAACAAPTYEGGAVQIWTGKLSLGRTYRLTIDEEPGLQEEYKLGWFSGDTSTIASLDDVNFAADSTHTIVSILQQLNYVDSLETGNLLTLAIDEPGLSATEARQLALHICNKSLAFNAADFFRVANLIPPNYQWVSPGIDWLGHAERTLYISRDQVAPTLSSATVDGTELTLTFTEELGEAASLANTAFTGKRTSGGTEEDLTLSSTAPVISGRTVTLTLASTSSVATTDTNVKVTYNRPTTGTDNKIVDRFGNEVATFTDEGVTIGTVNTPATGAPAITAPNVFRVPAVLSVDPSGIDDANGTTNFADNATYKWQRFAADGTTLEMDSIGTGATYTLTDDDAGKRIKVVVSYTDDDNYSEGPLTSAATEVIVAAATCAAPTYEGGAVQIWTGKLGIERLSIIAFGDQLWDNYGYFSSEDAQNGSLDDITFTAATDHVIRGIEVERLTNLGVLSRLSIYIAIEPPGLSTTEVSQLALHICGERLLLGESDLNPRRAASDTLQYYVWDDAGIDWREHAERTVYISRDQAAPTLTSAAVDGTELTLTFTEELGAADSLANSAFTVKRTPSGTTTEETLTLSSTAPVISGKTVTLTLASASSVAATDTDVKVTYTLPTTGTDNKIVDLFGNEVAAFTDQPVTNLNANTPATGAPLITTSTFFRVPAVLSVDLSGIMDTDGTTNIATNATYKWQRWNDTGTTLDTDSIGTGETYTLTEADAGKTIRVVVSFTDDGGGAEEVTSAQTPVIVPAQQSPPSLVSNLGQPMPRNAMLLTGYEIAYSFTTGPSASGYDLSSIQLRLARLSRQTSADPPSVKLVEGSPTGTEVATFSGPQNLVMAFRNHTFTPDSPVVLRSSQTYWVVASGGGGMWPITYSRGIDGSSSDGWSMGNVFRGRYIGGSDFHENIPGKRLMMRVNGSERQGTSLMHQAPNSPPTGWPGISGTVQIGQTLTATTDGIADPDGLTNPGFTYQWIRVDFATNTETNIGTGPTYTVTADDENKAIKVKVTFTDDAGNEESLTSNTYAFSSPLIIPDDEDDQPREGEEESSAAQEAAQEAVAGLTATIHDKPDSDSHDGENAFTFELRFSETPAEGFSYETVRDDTFTVTGGEVVKAKRLEPGKNLRWEITVTPSGNGNVVLSSTATTDCNADGAICTEDGDMFSGLAKFTIHGPASQESSDDDQDSENDQIDQNDEGSQDDESDETPVSLPSAPTGLTATVNSNGSITLTWNNPNDDTITGYQILRRRPAEGEGTLSVYVANTNSTTAAYTDTDVTAGTRHVYRIKAINSAGTGPRSSYVNVDP